MERHRLRGRGDRPGGRTGVPAAPGAPAVGSGRNACGGRPDAGGGEPAGPSGAERVPRRPHRGRCPGGGAAPGRRQLVLGGGPTAAALGLAAGAGALPGTARAEGTVSKVWGAVNGTQADIYYPPVFQGAWEVRSTLVSLDTPLGLELTQDPGQIERAREYEVGQTLVYRQYFIPNGDNRVVASRAANTKSLAEALAGREALAGVEYDWDIDEPNVLRIGLPDNRKIFVRVTRRFQDAPAASRLDTSEFFEQVIDREGVPDPKVKASRLLTKWKFREEAPEGEPLIVATQVMSDYLTSYDGEKKLLDSQGKPVSVWTYKMSFSPLRGAAALTRADRPSKPALANPLE